MNYSRSNISAFNIIKKRKIKILLKEIKNQECFECSRLYPDYISLNNGIFICKDCVKNHLNLPKNISYIIKNDLNNLTLKNMQYLSYGGNRKLMEYINIEYPNLKKLSPIYFYKTNAMDYYRKYLEYLVEGGIKPIKPNIDIAYELMEQKSKYNNNKENKNNINNNNYKKIHKLSTIKSDSFIKINKNYLFYPKIKPIVGTRNEFKLSQSLSKNNNLNLGYNNQNLNLFSSIFNNFNYLNNSLKEEFLINGKLKPSSSDYKYKYDSPNKNNYDMDGNDEDINEMKDNEKDMNVQINDISGINEFNEKSLNFNNINNNLKLKDKIIKRNKQDTNIKVLKIKKKINNKFNNNNNIYTKPVYQNYLYTFQNSLNNNINNKNCFKNKHFFIDKNSNIYNIKKTRVGKNIVNSIEDLRKYLNNKYKQKEKYIFNLKTRSNNKSLQIDNSITLCLQNQSHKEELTNINNSIIINKNLNVYYNDDDSLQTIFKKKAIGNAFTLNEKNQKINKFNYSL